MPSAPVTVMSLAGYAITRRAEALFDEFGWQQPGALGKQSDSGGWPGATCLGIIATTSAVRLTTCAWLETQPESPI